MSGKAMGDQNAPEQEPVFVARCPEHGLHGERTECFVCLGDVEQVPMADARAYARAITERDELVGAEADLRAEAGAAERRADRYRRALTAARSWAEKRIDPIPEFRPLVSLIAAALAEGEQPAEYGPAATGVGESCELGGDVHGAWCDHEGEQPAGECPGCRDTGIRIGALESPTVTCDCEAGAREDARWTASAAGEQSTTETGPEDEPFKIADLVVVVDQGNSMIPEGKPGFWLKSHPVMGELVQFALGSSWVKSVRRAVASPSTTETATGHDYSLIDAVLPAEGERRDELIELVGLTILEAKAKYAENARAGTWQEEWPDPVAEAVLDALREAAAPATPAATETATGGTMRPGGWRCSLPVGHKAAPQGYTTLVWDQEDADRLRRDGYAVTPLHDLTGLTGEDEEADARIAKALGHWAIAHAADFEVSGEHLERFPYDAILAHAIGELVDRGFVLRGPAAAPATPEDSDA